MANIKEIVNKSIDRLKNLLNEMAEPIKNEQAKLTDGTIIDFEKFEVDSEVNKVLEDGTLQALEDGDYEIEDGRKFSCAGGKFTSVTEAPEDVKTEKIENVVLPTIEERLKKLEDSITNYNTNQDMEIVEKLIEKLNSNYNNINNSIKKIENRVDVIGKSSITNLVDTKKPIETAEPVKKNWIRTK